MTQPDDSCTPVSVSLWRGGLFLLVGLTLLCAAVLFGRSGYGGWKPYHFLTWNLFLAWVPYLCSLAAVLLNRWRPARPLLVPVLAVLWLAFLPNAPYILTDFKHLNTDKRAIWYAYDAALIGTFATTGCLLGAMSLLLMQSLVCRYAGSRVGWTFAGVIVGLSGLGIYMGRVLRWNSWWLVTRPTHIADTLSDALSDPLDHPRAMLLSVSLAVFLMGCYILFYMLSTRLLQRSRSVS